MLKSLARLGLAAIAAGLLVPHALRTSVEAQQSPVSPYARIGDDGVPIHIVPTTAVAAKNVIARSDAGDVQGNATVYPSPYGSALLTDHGGGQIPNARVQAIFWNAAVANSTATSLGYSTIKDQIEAFLTAFSDGVNYRDALTADYTIIQQYGSRNTIAATLGKAPYYLDSQTTAASITDTAIRTYLTNLFNAGTLSASPSTLYAVFFPPGMVVNAGGDLSCQVFCGYHTYLNYNGQQIPYAAMPYLNCNGCPFTLSSSKSIADQLTVVLSHEIREAVTDPYLNAWYDSSGNEADDKCNATHLYQISNGNFWVQPEWSNGGTVTRSGFTATYPGPGCIVPTAAAAVAPNPPTNLTATAAGSSQINLSWAGSSGATSYVVKRSTSPGAEVTLATGVATTSYSDTGLSAGTTYYYVVAASNATGTSANSGEAFATTSGVQTAPSAPTGLTATVSGTQIALSWTASASATSYTVKRSTVSGAETTLAGGVTSTSYTDTGLTVGTRYYYVVTASNAAGTSGNSSEVSGVPVAVAAARVTVLDYDGDGKTDLVVFRPSAGAFLVLNSASSFVSGAGYTWGASTDTAIPGDFDGDRKTDLVVFRASTGEWYVKTSSSGYNTASGYQWGAAGDTPVPGDYDGDGKTDLAVYRSTTGEWFIKTSSSNYTAASGYQWGARGDVPVTGDYDGDGKADLAVYRPTTGEWFIKTSSSNYTAASGYQWGAVGDTPVPGDYDGDGKTDLAVYRPTTGEWFYKTSS